MANYKKQVIEKLNELSEYDYSEYQPKIKNKLKNEVVIFEGCQNLEADSLAEAEIEYTEMFNKHIQDNKLENNLKWVGVEEGMGECAGSYNLYVRQYYK